VKLLNGIEWNPISLKIEVYKMWIHPQFVALILALSMASLGWGQTQAESFLPAIPKTWDDAKISSLEVPLANPVGSPKHVPADYYYRIPVRPIYRDYPVYAPGREPQGYMAWLKLQEPEIIWGEDKNGQRRAPPLKTEADWIRAGEIVFDSPISFTTDKDPQPGIVAPSIFRDPAFYTKTGMPLAKGGVNPFVRYVIREKGEIELAGASCGTCHTRVMAGGTVIKGAQGNMPFDRMFGYVTRRSPVQSARDLERFFYAAPWLHPDPQAQLERMSVEEIASAHEAIPQGVLARHRASPFYPTQIPDLIGVKERHYLDRTGLQQQHSIGDLMRYAALNQGGDDLASFGGFIPDGGPPDFSKLPDPADSVNVSPRYSDEQLYALALYVYSLQPPPDPNNIDEIVTRGQKVFQREACDACHTPPLYSNNKLTPADGFNVPADHLKKYDILPISVGTDSNLTMKTRRGTGYYKVPSLKGVWYRSMFGHSGWCATLEDWFDLDRTRDDYVPTGFKPYAAKTYAVKGHSFGLGLSVEDKKALIAFLRTL